MRLVTSLQMRECDRRTIAGENLPAPTDGLFLMERAGLGIFTAIRGHCRHLSQRPVLIFCGRGNNGGDGLVVGRLLQQRNLWPSLFLLAEPHQLSPDAAVQYERYVRAGGRVRIVPEEGALESLVASELRASSRQRPILVDALLGTGSRGAPRGVLGSCVELINQLRDKRDAEVVAVDLPTGINADTGAVAGKAVVAQLTVTMAYVKAGFLRYPARTHLGRVQVVDIGIPHSVEEDVGLPIALMTLEEATRLLPHRAPDVHKGGVGKILIVGGSPGLTGAPAMAAMAALRAGAGLVTVALPRGLNPALEAKLTEVMTLPCPQTAAGSLASTAAKTILARAGSTDVWVLGPGLGREGAALELVRALLGRLRGAMVLDADALFALGVDKWWRPEGVPPAILTPHPGEMARLLGVDLSQMSDPPWDVASSYARQRRCVLVLKGAPTVVASPAGDVWINPSGNAGLATGGSGDALAGVIAALLGQGLEPVEAARLGVFLHGLAADCALPGAGLAGLLPTDLIASLPQAWGLVQAGTSPTGGEGAWIRENWYRIGGN
ncbi:MAG: NAD(P)H-hydrate dehydratase [Candidatus Eisenbacteria sp.]|nr:NAD(P)H-hydrate dehydratase [Candidatus Eisenbacteria bacterium]